MLKLNSEQYARVYRHISRHVGFYNTTGSGRIDNVFSVENRRRMNLPARDAKNAEQVKNMIRTIITRGGDVARYPSTAAEESADDDAIGVPEAEKQVPPQAPRMKTVVIVNGKTTISKPLERAIYRFMLRHLDMYGSERNINAINRVYTRFHIQPSSIITERLRSIIQNVNRHYDEKTNTCPLPETYYGS
ncbi:uncharacterized protein LOC116339301 [Contarinia nasturtii]|uniref:uncharacterized protein LOC116339301 n=1 Tax=Contarinia nasturtii TaxID=265458 RepID=UPI0012D3C168|nr:uncharacterized protein LOC116339301 [Contarinia nasturtii]